MHGATVTLKELPPYLPKAFLAIEDRRFYSHFGIDPIGLARAAVANVMRRGVSQGGSTITQQLAKNLFLTQERTFARKLQEVVLALWLERKFSKTEILELYLNRVYFGAGAYGVDAAAQRYFGKSARQVTIAEAAMLAGPGPLAVAARAQPQSRRRRAPRAGRDRGDDAATATSPRRMAQARAGAARARGEDRRHRLRQLRRRLDHGRARRSGRPRRPGPRGAHLDRSRRCRPPPKPRWSTSSRRRARSSTSSQGALVAMTPTGAVRALVGGRNYAESQFNRAVAARRQPGSAFKPFVYLTALERGLDAGHRARGQADRDQGLAAGELQPRILRPGHADAGARAFAQHRLGAADPWSSARPPSPSTAYRLGIASKLEPNPSLALGTSEVSLIELVSAYAPFANGGNAIAPYVVERVSTKAGKTLYHAHAARPRPHRRAALRRDDERDDARDAARRHRAARAQLPGWQAAGKTGTSQDFRDAWFVGYTAHLVTGVWLGNDDSSPTRRATGGGLPVEIWTRFMRTAHQGVAVAALPGQSAPPVAGVDHPAGG